MQLIVLSLLAINVSKWKIGHFEVFFYENNFPGHTVNSRLEHVVPTLWKFPESHDFKGSFELFVNHLKVHPVLCQVLFYFCMLW